LRNAKVPQMALEYGAIDPKRSVRLTAAPSTPQSDLAPGYVQNFSVDVAHHKKDAQRLEQDSLNTKEDRNRRAGAARQAANKFRRRAAGATVQSRRLAHLCEPRGKPVKYVRQRLIAAIDSVRRSLRADKPRSASMCSCLEAQLIRGVVVQPSSAGQILRWVRL
jgi:hypothetical protein